MLNFLLPKTFNNFYAKKQAFFKLHNNRCLAKYDAFDVLHSYKVSYKKVFYSNSTKFSEGVVVKKA